MRLPFQTPGNTPDPRSKLLKTGRVVLVLGCLFGAAHSSVGENLAGVYSGPGHNISVTGTTSASGKDGANIGPEFSSNANTASGGGSSASRNPSRIRLLVVLAWEGRDINSYNIDALRAFRAQFRDVTFLHLLSPAYFTRLGASSTEVTAQLREVLRPQDQLALLLGGWQSVAAKAGVIYRSGPTFWGYAPPTSDCSKDCGMDVPLSLYPEADLDKLFTTALSTLQENGYGRPVGYAVEGWMDSPQVEAAAVRSGMRYDFSPVAPEILARSMHNYPLYAWVKELWTQVTPHSQPFNVATGSGQLTAVPQSLGAMDYLAVHESTTIFREYVDRTNHEQGEDLVFPLVIYQETARATLPLLANALQEAFAYASANQVSLTAANFAGLNIPAGVAGQNTDFIPSLPPPAPKSNQPSVAPAGPQPAAPLPAAPGPMPIAH